VDHCLNFVSKDDVVLYCDAKDGIVYHCSVDTTFTPDFFEIGAFTTVGDVDNQYAMLDVAASIQLYVFRMIDRFIEKARDFGVFSINDIIIFLKDSWAYNAIHGGCYGFAEIAMILVIPKERVSQ